MLIYLKIIKNSVIAPRCEPVAAASRADFLGARGNGAPRDSIVWPPRTGLGGGWETEGAWDLVLGEVRSWLMLPCGHLTLADKRLVPSISPSRTRFDFFLYFFWKGEARYFFPVA